ncbi:mechanosensitive ion channel family protein [Marivita sp. XM-24bin2]|jgi:small-conductance mechanosensitive channel|uniref:mechanosensitive ion channel family protein n=1 Tax=unclassified Marivita TaxID=2632480 RepID=UPI000D7948A9|nr:mechanosensitive ion channel family protein [Marivita sp. XM-24bin2]MCR9110561.1 mechanosensitive ion channel [Paracoccaceae bacterium]PWL35400.1 MAG: mechanosensitive ion channel protein MscS [Marivita sp. XM-24bin2]
MGILRRLVFVVGLFVIGTGPVPLSAQTAEQPTGTIAVSDSAEQDAAIATRIREILMELDGYDDVTVTVNSGIVTLRGTALDGAALERLNEIAGRVEGVVTIENRVQETTDVARRLDPALERFFARFEQFINYLPLLAIAVAAFTFVVMIGFVIARLKRPWDRLAPNAFIADIYRQVIRIAFILGGLVIALDIVGATALLSTILGAAGIIGLAIGFAVRDTVENFIASIMLSIRQPFRPNDQVEIEGDIGKVIRLTSRATILLSFDGNHIRIPNATVFKSRIVNYSRNDERRFLISLGVAYDTDLARAQDLALQTITTLPFVIDEPAPAVWIEELGDSAIILNVAGWIRQHETSYLKARSEAWRLCIAAFDHAGIVMPETTLRVVGIGESDGAVPKASETKQPRPSNAAAVAAATATVGDTEAAMDKELERIVASERAEKGGDDLLEKDAPEE